MLCLIVAPLLLMQKLFFVYDLLGQYDTSDLRVKSLIFPRSNKFECFSCCALMGLY